MKRDKPMKREKKPMKRDKPMHRFSSHATNLRKPMKRTDGRRDGPATIVSTSLSRAKERETNHEAYIGSNGQTSRHRPSLPVTNQGKKR